MQVLGQAVTATVPGIICAVRILVPFTPEEPRASRNKGYGFWAAKEKPGRQRLGKE